ncbi:hypothetical protein BGX38DRAFT_1288159 [Terfezia claveryi]|nr:hypothetical protein BGX38DRAFT_1288159 [Terfezia claveryi]
MPSNPLPQPYPRPVPVNAVLHPIAYVFTPTKERTGETCGTYLISLGFNLETLESELRQLCRPGTEFGFDMRTDARKTQFKDDLASYLPRIILAERLSVPAGFTVVNDKMGGSLFWWFWKVDIDEAGQMLQDVKDIKSLKETQSLTKQAVTELEERQTRVDMDLKLVHAVQEDQSTTLTKMGEDQAKITAKLEQTNMLREAVLETTMQRIKRERNLHRSLSIQLRIFQPNAVGCAGAPIPHVQAELLGGGLYNRVTIGNAFDYVFDGEILTSEAKEIAASVMEKFLQSGPNIAMIYLFLGSSGAGKSQLFEHIISHSQLVGCQRAQLEEWVPGHQTTSRSLVSLADAAKTVATGANQHSSRTVRVAKICHTPNREVILLDIPGDECALVRQSNAGPSSTRIALMLQELRALLVHYFPPPRNAKHVLFNKPTDSVIKSLMALLEPYDINGGWGPHAVKVNVILCMRMEENSRLAWKTYYEFLQALKGQ